MTLIKPTTPPLVTPAAMAQERLRQSLAKVDPYFGFARMALGVVHSAVADPIYNLGRIVPMIQRFADVRADLGVLPELCTTAYTADRLQEQTPLIRAGKEALIELNRSIKDIRYNGVVIAGAALVIDNALLNCAAVMCQGKFLGIAIKRFPPNQEEFNELKSFHYGDVVTSKFIMLDGQKVPVGWNLVFDCQDVEAIKIGVGICEDEWSLFPTSPVMAAHGVTMFGCPNTTDELIGKEDYRLQQVLQLSARCMMGYGYVSSGPGESTTRVAMAGCAYVADNGTLLEEVKPLSWIKTIADPNVRGESMIYGDIDLDHLLHDRLKTNSWVKSASEIRRKFPARHIKFWLKRPNAPRKLARTISSHPYIPVDPKVREQTCKKIVQIKMAGLVTRLLSIGNPDIHVANSGGLDSSVATVDAVLAKRLLGQAPSAVHCWNLPGFGSGERTKASSRGLCEALGVKFRIIDIRPHCLALMKAIGYTPYGIDITKMDLDEFLKVLPHAAVGKKDLDFENMQAHMRTLIVTRQGFTLGTGNMLELITGWCTFLADQLGGHYNMNATMAKGLGRFQLKWQAEHDFVGETSKWMLHIAGDEPSPELDPLSPDGKVVQKTDLINGAEEVRDFFVRYFRRHGDSAEKILYLIAHAQTDYQRQYAQDELKAWWERFATRVFGQRFKSNTRLDGVQLGSDFLAEPGWQMPSDAKSTIWQPPAGFDVTKFLPKDGE